MFPAPASVDLDTDPVPHRSRRPAWRRLLPAAAILVAVFIAYRPAFRAGFLWDDDRYLTANPLLDAADGWRRIWLTSEPKDYYPVLYSLLRIERRFWGLDPHPYHALNICLHAVTALLLWRILLRLRSPGAWLAAVLYAIHPVNVESVAWISQQKNTLALFFLAVSVWGYLAGQGASRWPAWVLGAIVAFTLSLLSKPVAAALPAFVLLHGWWRDGRLHRRTVLAALLFLVPAAAVAVVTVRFQYAHSLAGETVGPESGIGTLAHAVGAWLFYLRKILVPVGLAAIYPADSVRLTQPAHWATATVLLAAVLILRRMYPAARRPVVLALGWYTAMLLPVLGLFKIGFLFYAPVADHWAAAAMPGILAPLAAGGTLLYRRGSQAFRLTGGCLAAAAVLLLSWRTTVECHKYESQDALFTATLAVNPRAWAAHTILGNEAFTRGDLDTARARYEQACRLNPNYCQAVNGLGAVLASQGEFEAAIHLFELALRLKPGHARSLENLQRARADLARRRSASGEPVSTRNSQ